MTRITHVLLLCPVDFSDISQHAFDHAAAIARWYEARLTVLYVFVTRPTMDLPPLTLAAGERDRLMSDLRRFAAGVPPGVQVDFLLEEAYVHEEILRFVMRPKGPRLVRPAMSQGGDPPRPWRAGR